MNRSDCYCRSNFCQERPRLTEATLRTKCLGATKDTTDSPQFVPKNDRAASKKYGTVQLNAMFCSFFGGMRLDLQFHL